MIIRRTDIGLASIPARELKNGLSKAGKSEFMLRNDRIYKSMDLDDFMLNTSFILAKGGVALTAHIANFNYEKSLPNLSGKSEKELKHIFIEGAKHIVNDILALNIDIVDMEKYYDVWTNITD